ncbi:MAG: ATP-binding protein [Candidatus Omnitrophica bacterium]|nr:ATP-binding protein [Candidatus Omnitrophota bacterium]
MIDRIISLPPRGSFLLFGPRQTGKSTLIDMRYPHSVWKVDLLLSELFLAYTKDPSQFRLEAIEKIRRERVQTIVLDEVQRVPALLNEVQALIQQTACQFILLGSSARKLKRGGANLLAGRAVERRLFPFVTKELQGAFSLDEALVFGTLPPVVGRSRQDKIDFLSAYVHTYLREEIQSEGLARNLGGFSRFLDVAAAQCGDLTNYSAIGRECQLPTRTVQSYYDILEDTLIGLRLEPWRRSVRKRLSAHSKFYLFDLGVTNAIARRLTGGLDAVLRGRLFEQWVVLETARLLHYQYREARLFYWRTNHGAEVDLLIEQHGRLRAAVEIKATSHIAGRHLSGLRAFREEYPKTPCLLVCTAARAFELDRVHVLPWPTYLERLPDLLA